MKSLGWLAVLVLLSGCPQSSAQQCPDRTVAVAQFTVVQTGQPDAGNACVQNEFDGGGIPLTLVDGGASAAALCYGMGSKSTTQLYYVVAGKGARASDVRADGGFHFTGHTDQTTGICEGCAVTIDESFDGHLQADPAGTPFVMPADGGRPPVTGLTGTLVDAVTSDAGVALTPDAGGCHCNVPCTVTYSVTGSGF